MLLCTYNMAEWLEVTPPVEEKRKNGKRCVAMNCSNTNNDGVSLHFFPTSQPILNQWNSFVKTKSKNWHGPTKYSVLCSDHFDESCYPDEYKIRKSMGFPPLKKKRLKENAVPTIQKQAAAPTTTGETDADELEDLHSQWIYPNATSTPYRKKGPRMAFVKRENSRILASSSHDHNGTLDSQDESLSQEDVTGEVEHTYASHDDSEGNPEQKLCNIATQTFAPSVKSKKTQANLYRGVNKECQTKTKVKSRASTCNILMPATSIANESDIEVYDRDSDSDLSEESMVMSDDSYQPSEGSSDDDMDDIDAMDDSFCENLQKSRRFIVNEENLMELFQNCPKCCNKTLANINQPAGTYITVVQECGSCGYHRTWSNQPKVGNIPETNILLSAAILFSGCLPGKILKMFSFLSIVCICKDTFMRHQRNILRPAVSKVWDIFQTSIIERLQRSNSPLILGGDGRADTPGHSAKYGSYSLLDLERGVVIDIQLVQSNEVKSSIHMEKEGLRRAVQYLMSKGLSIGTIITDRHLQINKWIRENLMDTKHLFDVWHVAKGFKKKLTALWKEKDCDELGPWIKSISNHLYWVATSEEDDKVVWEKWTSITNHIQNVHTGHGEHFPECAHSQIQSDGRRKKWLKPGTKVFEKLTDIVNSRQMKKDVPRLSGSHQTSAIEGFHSLINHFAPKMMGFSYKSMRTRLLLAALHYNENGHRQQATTHEGEPRFNIVYPKYKDGHVVRDIKVPCSYEYVEKLMDMVKQSTEETTCLRESEKLGDQIPQSPPPLCNMRHHPIKERAIAEHVSRFLTSKKPV